MFHSCPVTVRTENSYKNCWNLYPTIINKQAKKERYINRVVFIDEQFSINFIAIFCFSNLAYNTMQHNDPTSLSFDNLYDTYSLYYRNKLTLWLYCSLNIWLCGKLISYFIGAKSISYSAIHRANKWWSENPQGFLHFKFFTWGR